MGARRWLWPRGGGRGLKLDVFDLSDGGGPRGVRRKVMPPIGLFIY